jgi:hypothetical protein
MYTFCCLVLDEVRRALPSFVFFKQEEIDEVRVELKHLEFKEEVLKKQKGLLAKFANDVSTVHSMTVSVNNSCAELE